jgi:hypothetical protein
MVERRPGESRNAAERRHVGDLRCLDVHARQFPHGPDVQLGRGDPLPRPATSLLSGENVKTLAPLSRLKPEKIAIYTLTETSRRQLVSLSVGTCLPWFLYTHAILFFMKMITEGPCHEGVCRWNLHLYVWHVHDTRSPILRSRK